MDGGRHDDFSTHDDVATAELRSVDLGSIGEAIARPRPNARSRRGRAIAPDVRGSTSQPAASQAPKPFHYASARTMMLGQLADMMLPGRSLRLSADARRMPVIGVRLTSRTGRSVHAAPVLTGEALFVDHRDLAALDAGAVVPDLAAVVESVR